MADITEIDYTTTPPTITQRDFTPEEKKQREDDAKAAAEQEKIRAEKELAEETAKNNAIEHAKSLGFTDEMIAVMYPNLSGA